MAGQVVRGAGQTPAVDEPAWSNLTGQISLVSSNQTRVTECTACQFLLKSTAYRDVHFGHSVARWATMNSELDRFGGGLTFAMWLAVEFISHNVMIKWF